MVESESVLLERFVRAGDAGAFAEIVRRHAGLVYGTCLRVLTDADQAADATQETFFQLMKKAHEITGSIPSWLHRVAVGKAVDLVRADSRRRQREQAYAETRSRPDLTWREICPYVDEALESLDERTRELLIRHCLEGQSMTDLAGELGVSRPTVSRRVDAGLRRLRAQLQRRGIIVAAGGLSAVLAENTARSAPVAVLQQVGKMSLLGVKAAASSTTAPAAGVGVLAATNAKLVVTAVAIAAAGVGLFAYRHLPSRPPQSPRSVPPPAQSERRTATTGPRTQPAATVAPVAETPDVAMDSSELSSGPESSPGPRTSGALQLLIESLSASPEPPVRPTSAPLDLSTPEATVRSFVRAVTSDDAESVIACFSPDGQDYRNVERMLAAEPGEEDYQVKMVMQALDPEADVPILSTVQNSNSSVKVVWKATFKSKATVEGHTFFPGDHMEMGSLLVQSGDSWLIDGM